MKDEFAILPWEYRGSNFNPVPHAVTSLNLGGRERKFLLKMREGVIYFKEPQRSRIFAVLRIFNSAMHGEELIEAWNREVGEENYGRVATTSHYFSGSRGNTVVVSVHRADFSGWVCDAFHPGWHETPKHRDGLILDLWNEAIDKAKLRAVRRASYALFDRVISPEERQPVRSRWLVGNKTELRRIFPLVVRLYARTLERETTVDWRFHAINIAAQGGFNNGYISYSILKFAPPFSALVRLIEQNFAWIGMRWKNHNGELLQLDPYDVASPQALAMQEKWGEHWRGHYEMVLPSIPLKVKVPVPNSLSQHERLEMALELRQWLQGKVSPRQYDKWLSQIPD